MLENFEFDPEKIPSFKLAFHILQIVFAFVVWCLEITVFRADNAVINGNNGWTFSVCFLSIPAWIYLAMAPRFPRTRKLAQPHAMLVIDALFTIIWISAFSTQAAYNTANSCGTACAVSKAIVGLGFFTALFWGVTTFLSAYTLKYYQCTNRLPGYGNLPGSRPHDIDPDKAAFSMSPHDDEAYAPVNMHDDDAPPAAHLAADPYGRASSPYGAPSPGLDTTNRYGLPSQAGSDLGYGGASTVGGVQDNPFRQDNPFGSESSFGGRYAAPAVHDEHEYRSGPAQFPAANYDRIGIERGGN